MIIKIFFHGRQSKVSLIFPFFFSFQIFEEKHKEERKGKATVGWIIWEIFEISTCNLKTNYNFFLFSLFYKFYNFFPKLDVCIDDYLKPKIKKIIRQVNYFLYSCFFSVWLIWIIKIQKKRMMIFFTKFPCRIELKISEHFTRVLSRNEFNLARTFISSKFSSSQLSSDFQKFSSSFLSKQITEIQRKEKQSKY